MIFRDVGIKKTTRSPLPKSGLPQRNEPDKGWTWRNLGMISGVELVQGNGRKSGGHGQASLSFFKLSVRFLPRVWISLVRVEGVVYYCRGPWWDISSILGGAASSAVQHQVSKASTVLWLNRRMTLPRVKRDVLPNGV